MTLLPSFLAPLPDVFLSGRGTRVWAKIKGAASESQQYAFAQAEAEVEAKRRFDEAFETCDLSTAQFMSRTERERKKAESDSVRCI